MQPLSAQVIPHPQILNPGLWQVLFFSSVILYLTVTASTSHCSCKCLCLAVKWIKKPLFYLIRLIKVIKTLKNYFRVNVSLLYLYGRRKNESVSFWGFDRLFLWQNLLCWKIFHRDSASDSSRVTRYSNTVQQLNLNAWKPFQVFSGKDAKFWGSVSHVLPNN